MSEPEVGVPSQEDAGGSTLAQPPYLTRILLLCASCLDAGLLDIRSVLCSVSGGRVAQLERCPHQSAAVVEHRVSGVFGEETTKGCLEGKELSFHD